MTLRVRRGLIVGIPLVTAVLLAFHPTGEGDIYPALSDDVNRWLVVHVGFAVLIPCMALAGWLLLDGLKGRAASVSRLALVVFIPFYLAWEAALGIGTGVLVDNANALPRGERAAAAETIQDFFENPIVGDPSAFSIIGGAAWVVAMLAAAVALRRSGAGWGVTVLVALAVLFSAHPFPFGPVGLICFAAAALLIERKRPWTAGASAPAHVEGHHP